MNRSGHASRSPDQSRIWEAAPLLILLVALGATLASSVSLGFVSDDYENLVEASYSLPLTVSFDGLHRPIRDIVFKVAYRTFRPNTVPYHVGIILLHLLAVAALYRFVVECRAHRWAAVSAASLYGFFPRNHQVVFWLSAGQDSVVIIGALIAGIALLRFKETLKTGPLLLLLAAVTIALGFKETAVAIFPLLVLVDLCCGGLPLFFSWRQGLKLYLPLVLLGGLYLIWFKGYLLPDRVSQSFYGIQSVGQSLKMAVKDTLNMLLPFSDPVETRGVIHHLFQVVPLLLLVAVGVIGSYRFVTPRKFLLTLGWVTFATAPTAVLGFYTDRYLGSPFVGLALLVGLLVEGAIAEAKETRVARIVVVAILLSYSVGSIWRLTTYRHL